MACLLSDIKVFPEPVLTHSQDIRTNFNEILIKVQKFSLKNVIKRYKCKMLGHFAI